MSRQKTDLKVFVPSSKLPKQQRSNNERSLSCFDSKGWQDESRQGWPTSAAKRCLEPKGPRHPMARQHPETASWEKRWSQVIRSNSSETQINVHEISRSVKCYRREGHRSRIKVKGRGTNLRMVHSAPRIPEVERASRATAILTAQCNRGQKVIQHLMHPVFVGGHDPPASPLTHPQGFGGGRDADPRTPEDRNSSRVAFKQSCMK